jgi:hypothetical protein
MVVAFSRTKKYLHKYKLGKASAARKVEAGGGQCGEGGYSETLKKASATGSPLMRMFTEWAPLK